jgi:GNAT superfamily N-acetyltransferase
MTINFYQFHRLLNETAQEPVIMPISKDEVNNIISLCDETVIMPNFAKVCSMNPDRNWHIPVDWSKSIKLVLNNETIGFYLFSFSSNIDSFLQKMKSFHIDVKINEDVYEKIKNKKGVEGVSIGIKKEYRGLGYGRKLFEYPKKLGADYLWSIQTKGISDITSWLKRSELLANLKGFGQEWWTTVQIFNN